jgi:hypothetical protein
MDSVWHGIQHAEAVGMVTTAQLCWETRHLKKETEIGVNSLAIVLDCFIHSVLYLYYTGQCSY